MKTAEYALRAERLSKTFGGVQAVTDVSFAIAPGSLTALIGPNGAGKSTLFNLLTNLYRADAGAVRFFGTDLAGKTADAIARIGLVRTFQTARVFAGMTVLENVLAGAHARVRTSPWLQTLGFGAVAREERTLRERAEALLEVLGLARFAEENALSLPLGSQKLLEIARALMASPRMLLLDEPAAGLNDAETAELAQMLLAIRESGITVLVVEHNMSLVMGIAQDVIVLDAGRVIARGTPALVQADEAVIEAYVGRGIEELFASPGAA